MSREIRRASDNATGNALRPKGYGEWPKLMFKHRAKGVVALPLNVQNEDQCFSASYPITRLL